MEEQNTTGAGQPENGAPPVPAENANPNMKWYIIHTYSGFEKKVKESLESRIVAFGLQEKIGRVVIPTEPVTEIAAARSTPWKECSIPATSWCRWTWPAFAPEAKAIMCGTW